MNKLRRIVEETDTPAGRAFDIAVQALIFASLVAFSLETLPDLQPGAKRALDAFEAFSVAVFVAEYLLRLAVARRRLAFVFSFYGIVDLLVILPALTMLSGDLRSLRAFRLFRLVRILKLVRYSRAVDRFRKAFAAIRSELVVFLGACALVLYLASVGIYMFEHEAQPDKFSSVFAAMWWALSTLTTVGYGDVYPITTGGRVFTAFVLIVGLGVVAVPAGLVASALSSVLRDEDV